MGTTSEDQHCTIGDLLEKLDDVCLFEGTAKDYADSHLEETGILNQIPESLRYYFDSEAFAKDMLMNGDITEIRIEKTDYVVWG